MQLSELFTDTKQELEETTRELQHTGKQLELTSVALKVTERKLGQTTQERDEQKHLVLVHVKTEDKLHSQATKVAFCSSFLHNYKFFSQLVLLVL
jgi:kinesin family protein 11